ETIKKRRFDLEPDYLLDWRGYFAGTEYERSHHIIDPALWNGRMLPELQRLEERVNREAVARLIRARGLARLSAWFAFGSVFSRVAGYEIEVQQGAAQWRTDAPRVVDFKLIATRTPDLAEPSSVLAVGLSVTGSLVADMRAYLDSIGFTGGVLELEPQGGPSREAFRDAGYAAAFAAEAKKVTRQWVDSTGANEVLLFYFGPLSGACFLGHDLNALGASITIMEDQAPGYAGGFRLGYNRVP
ncbi:MAG: SAVED domain-containing protein, partial [Gammaproteobacteria bacterium]|nr:SAVED domain-containing protein [Gammaproteobacteria bacterium]